MGAALPGRREALRPNARPRPLHPLPGQDARVDLGPVRWVLVSGAVADRVEAARDVYPLRAAFYARLPKPVYRITARDGMSGPWVALYHL